MKYYVTADIHGFFTPMMKALTDAGYFTDREPHKLIILGDVLDRGREALKVQQFILDEMDKDRVILIRGNHEDLFEELVTEDNGKPYSHHVSNGTYDSALQLTGYDPVMASIRSYDFADAAKETAFFRKIMPSMKNYYETGQWQLVNKDDDGNDQTAMYDDQTATPNVTINSFTVPFPMEDLTFNPHLKEDAVHVDVRATYQY